MQSMTFILYSNNLWTIQTKRWTWQIYEWQNLMVRESRQTEVGGHNSCTGARLEDRVYVQNFIGSRTWLQGTIPDGTVPVSFRVCLSDRCIRKRDIDLLRIHYPEDSDNTSSPEVLDGPASSPAEQTANAQPSQYVNVTKLCWISSDTYFLLW